MNICAVIALSGLFTVASQSAVGGATEASARCEAVHRTCMEEGKTHEACMQERNRCYEEAYRTNPDAVLRNRWLNTPY